MTDGKINQTIRRGATTDSDTKKSSDDSELLKHDAAFPRKIRKLVSMDIGKAEVVKKSFGSSTASFIRHSVRGRTSKRLRRQEPDFGHDIVTYEEIRERVLQELAVTNAIDALHERWEMIMFMYDDCVELNELKRGRKLRKLCIQRQLELITIVSVFVLICFPLSVLFVLLNS